ncbi:MAG: iron-containing alcohol dehydrogenase [Chloroflexi bacterium]|nr:iron-containing alcohol dehydrogenase [Chloroflexota bacterium]
MVKSLRFEFATAARIVFGAGAAREIGRLAKPFGRRALLVTGRSAGRAEPMAAALKAQGVESVWLAVPAEPTTDLVRAGAQFAKDQEADLAIGFGGGSALDAAKAIAALLTNGGDLLDYLEVIGRAKPLTQPSLPCIALPTTAGSGAEVTRNAVLSSPQHRVKVSLRSSLIVPRLALVDPELTCTLPPAITASTGLDALTQLIEPYVSPRSNPMTDAFGVEGMRRVARSLRRAFEEGNDAAAREDMAVASLFGGLALANAGLGAVHGFASPIGGMFAAPHGAVCAALLPVAMEINVRALRSRAPGGETLRRFEQVARLLTGHAQAEANDGINWVRETCQALNIPPLKAYGLSVADFPALIEKAAQASSMKANPISLTLPEMEEILQRAW